MTLRSSLNIDLDRLAFLMQPPQSIMNAPLPIRAKLIAAAVSLLIQFSLGMFYGIAGRSSGEIIFRVGCSIFTVFITFWGVSGNAQFQLLGGWTSAFSAAFLIIALPIGLVPGSELLWGSAVALAAFIGAYLLLLDADVRDYRRRLKAKHAS